VVATFEAGDVAGIAEGVAVVVGVSGSSTPALDSWLGVDCGIGVALDVGSG
jgi:hypothetical protein